MKSANEWLKIGRVYTPSSEYDWATTHASVPIAELIEGDLFRIYFSTRDAKHRSVTTSVVMNINSPNAIIEQPSTIVLSPGALGEFDDSGAMGSWITHHEGNKYFYYIGWNLGSSVPFRNSIGLSINSNKEGFKRYSPGPIVDRTPFEPHFCASCCVLKNANKWRMWYLSCTEWFMQSNGKPEHRYHIKYAESKDGINWDRQGVIAIDYLDHNEIAISRPSVIFDKGIWKMWFSYRSVDLSYRIGYAQSYDGIHWDRAKGPVLEVSNDGWDSEMVAYPYVFQHKGQRYMLYNGNDYGRTGFGLAQEVSS
ncbi:glycoside hydrolase family protein [Paraglaciecola chathamensis]|uniref:Glycosyl hydrolase family 32 N-terminal domain-containing protein n=1 Tax=Paraglaciecola chathamensis S18K6 TaxID=1127672 RepID=A0AAV3V3G0_9ALTE|nr:hypothetical protein [Paraglaciecola chathamensis]GAC11309.1 hypothetical protein GCHA_3377 [Paraglaciecola chathamensis S18K6]